MLLLVQLQSLDLNNHPSTHSVKFTSDAPVLFTGRTTHGVQCGPVSSPSSETRIGRVRRITIGRATTSGVLQHFCHAPCHQHRTINSDHPASSATPSDEPMTTSSVRASIVKTPDANVNVRHCHSQRPMSISQRETLPRLRLRFSHPAQWKISVSTPQKP
jgi:hypothetical protein